MGKKKGGGGVSDPYAGWETNRDNAKKSAYDYGLSQMKNKGLIGVYLGVIGLVALIVFQIISAVDQSILFVLQPAFWHNPNFSFQDLLKILFHR